MAKPKKVTKVPTKTTQKKTQSKYRPLPMSPTAGINRGHRLGCGGKLKK